MSRRKAEKLSGCWIRRLSIPCGRSPEAWNLAAVFANFASDENYALEFRAYVRPIHGNTSNSRFWFQISIFGAGTSEELLAEKRIPVFLLGNFHDRKIPDLASAVFCRIDKDCKLGCVALNIAAKARKTELSCSEKRGVFDWSDYCKPVENRCPRMGIPESFWEGAAKLIRTGIGKCPLENPEDGALVMSMKNRQSVKRVALISRLHKYAVAKYKLEKDPGPIAKISPFPYSKLVKKENISGAGMPIRRFMFLRWE